MLSNKNKNQRIYINNKRDRYNSFDYVKACIVCCVVVICVLTFMVVAGNAWESASSRSIRESCDKATSTMYIKYGNKRYKKNPNASLLCQAEAKRLIRDERLINSQISVNNAATRILNDIEDDRNHRYGRRR